MRVAMTVYHDEDLGVIMGLLPQKLGSASLLAVNVKCLILNQESGVLGFSVTNGIEGSKYQ